MKQTMKEDIYWYGVKGEQYGIWNSVSKEWQFGICESTPALASDRLVQKIGDGARKWRFEVQPLPKEMRKAVRDCDALMAELGYKNKELERARKSLRNAKAALKAADRHGYWQDPTPDDIERGYIDCVACSICGFGMNLDDTCLDFDEMLYCPHCGARMDETERV